MVMVKRENGEETVGCRYVVARPSAISSPPTYTEARIHLEAPLMIHLLRGKQSGQQGKERLVYYLQQWTTIRTNKHTRWLDRYGCGHRTRVWRTISAVGVSREEKEAKSKYRVLLAVVAGKDE